VTVTDPVLLMLPSAESAGAARRRRDPASAKLEGGHAPAALRRDLDAAPQWGDARPPALTRVGEAAERIRVALHVEDPLVLPTVRNDFATRPEIELVGVPAPTPAEVTVVVVERVDRVALALLAAVRAAGGGRIVLVTDDDIELAMMAVVQLGLTALLRRANLTVERLATVSIAAGRGHGQLPPDVLGAMLGQLERHQRDVLEPHGLTMAGLLGREVDVLRLVAEGLQTAEIAKRLSYSERTVKNIIFGLLSRRGLRNRSHAVAYAMRRGLI